MSSRRLYLGVALAGFLSVTLATALTAHSILQLAQSLGLLGGDYGSHSHGSLFPIGLTAAAVMLFSSILYIVHLMDARDGSLPSLARALRRRISWHSVVLTAAGACPVLLAMEIVEQSTIGRFDGAASAFSAVPEVGFTLIFVVSLICNLLAWAICSLLENAHAQLVSVVAILLGSQPAGGIGNARRAKRGALSTFDYAWDVLQAHGKRAPPSLAS